MQHRWNANRHRIARLSTITAALAILLALALIMSVPAQAQEPRKAAITGLTLPSGDNPGDLVITWDAHPEGAEDYRVRWAPDGDKQSDWSEHVTGQSAPEPPSEPVTVLTTGPGSKAGELTVSWDAHPDGASSYHIARTADGQAFHAEDDSEWNATVTTNAHTVPDLDADAAYQVRVKAHFADDREPEWSESVAGQSAHEPADSVQLGNIADDGNQQGDTACRRRTVASTIPA